VGTITGCNYQGSATEQWCSEGDATVISAAHATYTRRAQSATATTSPAGLAVAFTYNGVATAPTNAGSYTVVERLRMRTIRALPQEQW